MTARKPRLPKPDKWKPMDSAPKDRRLWLLVKGYLAPGRWQAHQLAPNLPIGGRWMTENAALNRWLYESGNWPTHDEMAWQELDPPPRRRRAAGEAPIRRKKITKDRGTSSDPQAVQA